MSPVLTVPARLVSVALALALALGVLGTAPAAARAQQPTPAAAPLAPADGVPQATIRRTSFGIPHIIARDWTSLGFGNGYTTAEDAACNLADTLVTARGERSKYFGPDEIYDDQVTLRATNLQVDAFVTALRDRGVVEQLLETEGAAPSDRVRALVEGYVAGVNRYLEDVGGAEGITDPRCAGAEWVRPAEAIDLYYGIYLANLLASAGALLPQIVDATPPSPSDPGTPVDPGLVGIPFPPGDARGFASAPAPAAVDRDALLAGLGRDPDAPFGSNGTALGRDATTTGRGMVLGNPHFPWKGRYRFHQAQLTIPGVYDVAGGMLTGSPVVNIGWNHDVAWTHTVSTAWRFTPYEYRLVGPTTYLTESGPVALDRQEVTVEVLGDDGQVSEVTEDVYRTTEGFVLDAPELLMGWSLASVWALREANAEHLRTLDVFLEMGEARDVEELLAAHTRTGGMPWVNTMAADREGNALYADHSVVPHVTDAKVQDCATPTGRVLFELAGLPGLDGTRAQGACAWGSDEDAARPGIFGFSNLPYTIRSDWVINANDSYWLPNPAEPLEGYARIIGCERCQRTLRTRMVYRYVMDRLAGVDGMTGPDLFTHEQLKAIQVENRVFAAELARENDDLATACAASGVRQEACDVLAAWDGRSNTDSVGTILFREFWRHAPASPWEEGFDASRPVETPRDLDEGNADVQQAFLDAVAALDEAGIPLDAPLGAEQIASDDGEATGVIPIPGGGGDTGNANVVVVRGESPLDARYPIGYGSSHIQAVAFTDTGVDAATILTYGNADNPMSPHATDQTRLWSAERWVRWPYTSAEQLADPGYRAYRVRADAPREDLTGSDLALDPGFGDDVTATPPRRVERVAGSNRVLTAIQVARRTLATADVAVLARADDYPDALSGAPLATALGGPLLLTGRDALDPAVATELQRLGTAHVVLLGGQAALSQAVEDELAAAGYTVERVAGADRYATSAAVAERLGGTDLALVASGEGFADAVSAAGVAAALRAPVVLTAGDHLPDPAVAALDGRSEVLIVGGLAAVPDVVAAQIEELADSVQRAAGSNRYATSAAVLEAGLVRGLNPTSVWVATGQSAADALAAGASAGVLGTGVLLADQGAADPALVALGDVAPALVLVAGGPRAVADGLLDQLAAAR